MKGFLDRVEGNQIIGWCAPVFPGSPARMAVKIGNEVLARARADIERMDVQKAGICDACCGFELIVPSSAFDQYGLKFSIALERMDDGELLAEGVLVDGGGDNWKWSPADLAVIIKKWREASLKDRREIQRRLAGFDSSNLVDALMEHGFFEEVEAAIAAKEELGNVHGSWLTISGKSCSIAQVKYWAFECRLKAAVARARTAFLTAEFLDEQVMPVFNDAFESNIVTPSDWAALIDLFALCPAATSLAGFFQRLTGYLEANRQGCEPVLDACLRQGNIGSIEMAGAKIELRIRRGETVSAFCCMVLDGFSQHSTEGTPDLDSIYRALEKTTTGLQGTNGANDQGEALGKDPFAWPTCNGLRWPLFEMPESHVSVKVSFLLFVGEYALPEACHDSVLSILNQAMQGLHLLIVGNSDRLSAKTLEKLDRNEGVEVSFFSGNPEKSDLLREATGQIASDYVGWLEAGEMVSPWFLEWIDRFGKAKQGRPDSVVIVFDTAHFTGARIISHCSASHLDDLSADRLSRIEEDWLKQKFLSDGWFLVRHDIFVAGLSQLPALAGPDALQYAVSLAAPPLQKSNRYCGGIGLYRPQPIQPIEPLHSREIIQQAEQRSMALEGAVAPLEVEAKFRNLLSKYFKSGTRRITIMSTRFDKIFSPDTSREIREHFETLGYQADFVEKINPDHIAPSQLILVLVHQYGVEEQLIPVIAEHFPDCPLIGWFWDNHHQALGNVKIARYFHGCIAAHDFCRDVLVSRSNILLPSVPLCVTQWTAAEAKAFFAKHGHGERSQSLFGGFVRYATAHRRNEFVAALQKHLDPHALNLIDEFNLASYFALPAEERFAEWCRYRISLCLPLFHDLSQRFFDALLCGQLPIVTDDIVDMANVVSEYPDLVNRFEILPGYDMKGLERILVESNRHLDIDMNVSPLEQHSYALTHHMLRNRLESILSILEAFNEGH